MSRANASATPQQGRRRLERRDAPPIWKHLASRMLLSLFASVAFHATAAHAAPPFAAPFHAYEVPGSIRFVTAANVNDDGYADVIATHGDSGLSILWGDGAGSLISRTDLHVGYAPAQAVAADVNSDSRTDLLVPNAGAASVSVMLAQADGSF